MCTKFYFIKVDKSEFKYLHATLERCHVIVFRSPNLRVSTARRDVVDLRPLSRYMTKSY